MSLFHDQLRAYLEERGCQFERMTAKGRWRYLLLDRYPIEIPGDTEAYNARQWGNVKELAKREIDAALRRAGDRPDQPNPALTPTVFYQAPEPVDLPPPPVTPRDPEPVDPLPADDDLDAVIAREFPIDPTSGNGVDMAKAKRGGSKTGRKLKGQPCPVAGCGKPALGKHIMAHIKKGELPKGFKLTYTRGGVDIDVPVRRRRPGEVAVTAGPTSKGIKELFVAFWDGWGSLKNIADQIVKLAADQEETLKLVTAERDEYRQVYDGFQAMLSRTKPRTVTK
jgi:hypothetical protein